MNRFKGPSSAHWFGTDILGRDLWVRVWVGGRVSLIIAIVLVVLGSDPSTQRSAGADAYSRSAIGHRGLVDLLRGLDIPVVVSRHDSAAKGRAGVVVLAEPTSALDDAELRELVGNSRSVLVVLPKWRGYANPGAPWIERAERVSTTEIEDVLHAALEDHDARVVRGVEAPAWTADTLPAPKLAAPQLVAADGRERDLVTDTGALIVRREPSHGSITVLADPDVINNAGLRSPENARLAVALLDELRAGGPVIFDETIHGHLQSPSLWRVLFRFPLVLATLQVLVCCVLAMWAAMVRFGPAKAPPPPLAPGKDFLIRNTAALLRFGGHHGEALRRYLAVTELAVRRELHAPEGLARAAIVAWLERRGADRGCTVSLTTLERDVAAPTTPLQTVQLADTIYRWRQEMIHGPRKRS
jgi:hypothetical protein